MKKVWFLGLLAAAILAGCSDNDDNGDEVKPGGGQVESPYLPQRIAQVKVVKSGDGDDVNMFYYYDTRGRVNMLEGVEGNWGEWDRWEFSYFEDYSIASFEWVYNILNGKVVFMYGYVREKMKCEYDGDFLHILQWIGTDRYGEYDDTLMMDFSFEKDNLSCYTINKDDSQFQAVLEYGNRANELNIDMFYFLMRYVFYDLSEEVLEGDFYDNGGGEEEYFNPWLLGIAGKRSACLPESMEVTMPRESGDGEETRAYTYKYTMKGEYVSEMAILDAAGKEAYRFVFSYEE